MNKILKIITLELFFISTAFALSQKNEKKMYLGCYADSKQYIGPETAKKYCSWTIQMLANKYSNDEIEEIFKKRPREIIKTTKFVANHFENNKNY